MKVFQPKYKDKSTGKIKKVQHWYIGFTDSRRLRRRLPGFPNKAATERAATMLQELLSCGGSLSTVLQKWLEEIPASMRDRLVEWEIVDSRRWSENLGKNLTEHLADYLVGKRADKLTEVYVDQTERQIKHVLDGCMFKMATDIDGYSVKTYLAKGRGKDGYGDRSFNSYLRSFKSFCAWLARENRIAGPDPMRDCSLIRQTEFLKKRRALTANEVQRLYAVVEAGEPNFGMTGHERRLLYQLAIETGLRAGELRSLKVLSFDLTANPPYVHVDAADTKGKQAADMILSPDAAREFHDYLQGKDPQDSAFAMPHGANVVVMFKADLKQAEIAYTDASGRDVDFHSLRHTFITNLTLANTHPAVAQKLARHSSITLTMKYYTHVLRESEIAAMSKMFDLSQACQNGTQRQTNMDASGRKNGDIEPKTALSA